MRKEGYFALYLGKEYEADYDFGKDKVDLYSRDPNSLGQGFKEVRKGFFVKTVLPNEIQSAYRIMTFAEYKGHRFYVISIMNKKVHLGYGGPTPSIPERLGFTFIEPYVYEKEVGEEEVTRIWQEASALWDYSLPQENGN